MVRRQLTDVQLEDLLGLNQMGSTQQEIADAIGTSQPLVCYWLERITRSSDVKRRAEWALLTSEEVAA